MPPRMKNLKGQKFGHLKVDKYSKQIGTDHYWSCTCECGVVKDIRHRTLVGGQQSCGCRKSIKGNAHYAWRGYGEISLNYWNIVKRGASERGISFNLTIEDAWDLFLKQERKCALTGIPIVFNKTFNGQTSKTASLDRIDSTKGYDISNVQWIHKKINFFKGNMNNLLFIAISNLVSEQQTLDSPSQVFEDLISTFSKCKVK